ncbi:hypothetical protein D3C80_1675540 [compost metagenome]
MRLLAGLLPIIGRRRSSKLDDDHSTGQLGALSAVALRVGFDVRVIDGEVDLLALDQVGRHRLGLLAPQGGIDPLSRSLAVLALPAVFAGNGKVCHGIAGRGKTNFGVAANAAYVGQCWHCDISLRLSPGRSGA